MLRGTSILDWKGARHRYWSYACQEELLHLPLFLFEPYCLVYTGFEFVDMDAFAGAEGWRGVRAKGRLQASSGIHIGFDNLNVFRFVAEVIDSGITGTPTPPCQGW